jgi:two-component system, chemotaxis family, CheB/CheR fusion protein
VPDQPAVPDPHEKAHHGKLLVVGIGASAGGLEALSDLTQNVPVDSMAFVVVQHLSPRHESILPQLLSRSASLEVVTVADGMPLEPNKIFVIPPNTDLAVMQGVLHLVAPPTGRGPRMPIDFFFRAMAEDQGANAIGIVLSGTGSDGTFGLKAIKAAGGVTFAQEPTTAKYDGMPRSALASGAADFSLSPQEIGNELARIARQWSGPAAPISSKAPQQEQINKLFILLRAETGNDLTHYKTSTLERRIERRMLLNKIGTLEDYVKFVQSNRDELNTLYKDTLISVTNFFRDPEAYDALKRLVFPQILENKDPGQPVRIWVPACATGEEPYSLAMALLEYSEEVSREVKLQVFGTDIDDDAIQYARRGVYPANITLDVSPDRLDRYFVKKDGEYFVPRRIRDLVVFSKQNVLKDAPFSRIDLVSCRNLLIYLQPAAQKRVLRILHYATNPAGFLLLGTSETVADAPLLFTPLDRKFKVYARKTTAMQPGLDMPFSPPVGPNEGGRHTGPPRPNLSLQSVADRKVLDLYGPPGVLINDELEILQFRGHTGPFLDPAPGAATLNVLRVARFELHIELKSAIQQAQARGQRVTVEAHCPDGDKPGLVRIDVVPFQDPDTNARCMLVLFHRLPPPREIPVQPGDEADQVLTAGFTQRIDELEREVAATREFLQTTIEEKESTLEELKSANEELQSSNEELQSTNEELETSKEEMQSTNEELTTVNEELQNRMAELSQTNDDLHNVLAGVDNAVVIIGMDRKFAATPARPSGSSTSCPATSAARSVF